MNIIGVTAYYHDSSACLFVDDKLVFACEEEKFSGIKHDSSFPDRTIKYILEKFNLKKSDIDCVCYYEDPKLRLKRKKSFLKSSINNIKINYKLKQISNNIHYTPHHISHMSYSYLSSDFDKSLIVSIDGVGETSTISIGKGENGVVSQLKTIEYPNSLGLFYSAMTAFLGFRPNEGEYKVMGLASYGDPRKYRTAVNNLISYKKLTLKANMEYFVWDKSNITMFNEKLESLLNTETRVKDSDIEQKHKDIAASVQEVYEAILFKLLEDSKKLYSSENLCLGGGCAYNGTANGKLMKSNMFNNIWIPLAPSDAGSSIGSCLSYLSDKNIRIQENPFLGPKYSGNDIYRTLIAEKTVHFKKYDIKNILIKDVAKYLNDGLVVGWYDGHIEFGARALGNRSILANPTLPNMQSKINNVIKKRESFRPFAPMVVHQKQKKYFDSSKYIPYMNQVVNVNPEYIDKLPAVTHINGSSRIQSVKPDKKDIYKLLKEFEKISGYPILLNTSFNIKDKTIVLTPEDALETFIDTDMDLLVMGDYIVYKNNFLNE